MAELNDAKTEPWRGYVQPGSRSPGGPERSTIHESRARYWKDLSLMNMKRMRGRNNQQRHQGGGGQGGGGNGGSIVQRPAPMNRNHVFDSNGPDVRLRGTAHQLFDKYLQLGRDATSAGDRVMAESYFQHAEHYFRILQAISQQAQPGQGHVAGHQGRAPRNGYDAGEPGDEQPGAGAANGHSGPNGEAADRYDQQSFEQRIENELRGIQDPD